MAKHDEGHASASTGIRAVVGSFVAACRAGELAPFPTFLSGYNLLALPPDSRMARETWRAFRTGLAYLAALRPDIFVDAPSDAPDRKARALLASVRAFQIVEDDRGQFTARLHEEVLGEPAFFQRGTGQSAGLGLRWRLPEHDRLRQVHVTAFFGIGGCLMLYDAFADWALGEPKKLHGLPHRRLSEPKAAHERLERVRRVRDRLAGDYEGTLRASAMLAYEHTIDPVQLPDAILGELEKVAIGVGIHSPRSSRAIESLPEDGPSAPRRDDAAIEQILDRDEVDLLLATLTPAERFAINTMREAYGAGMSLKEWCRTTGRSYEAVSRAARRGLKVLKEGHQK